MEEGIKYDDNKLPISKLFTQFPDAIKAVILASLFGHLKYEKYDHDWLNYKRVAKKDCYKDAGLRHSMLNCPNQEESGLPPKIHVAWNALADLQIFLDKQNFNVENLIETLVPEWKKRFENE